MTGVQWLKLDKTNLSEIPEEMGKLLKLVLRTKTCAYLLIVIWLFVYIGTFITKKQ